VLIDLRRPIAAPPVERDALESRRVAAPARTIGGIIGMARQAQVAPPVVERVAVAVIDERPSPLAFHVEPGQLVRPIIAAVDVNGPILRPHAAPGDVPGTGVGALVRTPAKFYRARIVVQQLA
jgi:hypothetical protein